MRISELSRRAGVPLPTVKYYQREGLLHPGTVVTSRLAAYDESHLQRLQLLRVLREVGAVPVARLKALVQAAEASESLHALLGAAADALAPPSPPPGERRAHAAQVARSVVRGAGWEVREESADREGLAAVVETLLTQLLLDGQSEQEAEDFVVAVAGEYATAADRLAGLEIAALDAERGPERLMAQMVIGQVVLGRLLLTLRRLAEEHHSAQRFLAGPEHP